MSESIMVMSVKGLQPNDQGSFAKYFAKYERN